MVSVNEPCPASVFLATYGGVRVGCHRSGDDMAAAERVVVRGNAPARPAVPPDAVTASGSGLDPDISSAYALIQVGRVARERKMQPSAVRRLVGEHTSGRALGFLGEPHVNVVELNLALDRIAGSG
ncbi:MAG: potassium-transporting ATPase subunit C [Pseudonocardiales bacterium]